MKTISEITKEIDTAKYLVAYYKENQRVLENQLLAQVSAQFSEEMVSREKTHGSISKEIDGIKLTYEVKQTASWDQGKLRALWESLPSEIGNNLIKTEFSVSEAVFKNQVDPALIDALVDARTTKLSAPTIKLNK
jgi:hypothetical protein